MLKFENNPHSLQAHLDDLFESNHGKFALTATNPAEFEVWRKAFRDELKSILGILNHPSGEGIERCISIKDHPEYFEEYHTLQIEEKVLIPFYLLVPKGSAPRPAILVFHGHDPSVQWCLGNYSDEETKRKNISTENNYAQALAESGFVVCVVEQRGLSTRITNQQMAAGNSCRHLAFTYMMYQRTLLGERIRDGMAVLGWLAKRQGVQGAPGCTGHSAGGATALWLSALDDRISTVLVSGYFNSFRGSLLAMEHCECNYVPGILRLGEMGELAALIAPRPLCLLNGERDEIFPIQNALNQFSTVQYAYTLFGQETLVELKIHPGGHVYNNPLACAWFQKWMPVLN